MNTERSETTINIMDIFVPEIHPYFILSEDKTTNIPINTMDCDRIFDKINNLKSQSEEDLILWSPLHDAQFFLKDMTVVMDFGFSKEKLSLVGGNTFESPREEKAPK